MPLKRPLGRINFMWLAQIPSVFFIIKYEIKYFNISLRYFVSCIFLTGFQSMFHSKSGLDQYITHHLNPRWVLWGNCPRPIVSAFARHTRGVNKQQLPRGFEESAWKRRNCMARYKWQFNPSVHMDDTISFLGLKYNVNCNLSCSTVFCAAERATSVTSWG